MMNIKHIVIFQRPGEKTKTSEWILDNVVGFAKAYGIFVSYYSEDKSLGIATDEDVLFVAIGGDGTMLRTMDVSLTANIKLGARTSVIGFNAGNLGFLTEDTSQYMPSAVLANIVDNKDAFEIQERLALAVTVGGREHYAINEFTFTAGNIAAPLDYNILINGKFVGEHMGSGCMVATPTGSTAMSMSAGGAIIVPSARAMQIVPIIPHTLTSRPVITSDEDVITLTSEMKRVDEVMVSSDGRTVYTFDEGAEIDVVVAEQPVKVWYAKRRDFFNVLSTKLDW